MRAVASALLDAQRDIALIAALLDQQQYGPAAGLARLFDLGGDIGGLADLLHVDFEDDVSRADALLHGAAVALHVGDDEALCVRTELVAPAKLLATRRKGQTEVCEGRASRLRGRERVV